MVPTRRRRASPGPQGTVTTGTRRGWPTATAEDVGNRATEAAASGGPSNRAHVGHVSQGEKAQQEAGWISGPTAVSGATSGHRSKGICGADKKARVARARRRELSCHGRTTRLTKEPDKWAIWCSSSMPMRWTSGGPHSARGRDKWQSVGRKRSHAAAAAGHQCRTCWLVGSPRPQSGQGS